MSIQDELNKINNAVYGSEVRDAIHDGIKKAYDDASANGNANMEVEMARGSYPVLNARLNDVDNKNQQVNAQLAQKAEQAEVDGLDQRVDNLVIPISAENANVEVTDAHVSVYKGKSFDLLTDRFEEAERDIGEFVDFTANNFLANSDFTDTQEPWRAENGTATIENNVLTLTGNGTNAQPKIDQYPPSEDMIAGNVYYLGAKIKPLNEADKIAAMFGDGSIGEDVYNPTPNVWHHLSDVGVFDGYSSGILFNQSYADALTADGKSIEIKEVIAVDLTKTFGVGNEPTKLEFEFLLDRFSNQWFKGVKSLVTSRSLYTALRTQIEAGLAPGGYNKITTTLPFEHAGLNTLDGTQSKSNVLDFYSKKRTGKFLEVTPDTSLSVTFDAGAVRLFEYDKEMNHIQNYDVFSEQNYLLAPTTRYVKFEKDSSTGNVTVDYFSKNAQPNYVFNNRITNDEISFLYNVNINTGRTTDSADGQYDTQEYYTSGLLKLPVNYDPHGEPVKLIIFTHGSADYYAPDVQSLSNDYAPYLQYLVDEGYAIFDCWGWSNKYDLSELSYASQYATPTGIACMTQGYKWVTENFNIDKKGVFTAGKSLGGLNSISVGRGNKGIPVTAASALAPELSQIHINLGYNAPTRLALADDFGFEGDVQTILGGETVTANETYINFVKQNAEKMIGYVPYWDGLINSDLDTLVEHAINRSTGDSSENMIRIWQTPVKIWIAPDDAAVSYASTKNFIKTINNGHGIAELRTMPTGTGGHNSVDKHEDALKVSSITTRLGIEHTNVPLAYVEMVEFFRRFDN